MRTFACLENLRAETLGLLVPLVHLLSHLRILVLPDRQHVPRHHARLLHLLAAGLAVVRSESGMALEITGEGDGSLITESLPQSNFHYPRVPDALAVA